MKTSILSDCQYYLKMFRHKTPGGVLHMNHTVLSSWQLEEERSDGLYSIFATFPIMLCSKLQKYPFRADVFRNAPRSPHTDTSCKFPLQVHTVTSSLGESQVNDLLIGRETQHTSSSWKQTLSTTQLRFLTNQCYQCPRAIGQHRGLCIGGKGHSPH